MMKFNIEEQTMQKLRQQLGTTCYDFLGFTVALKAGTLTDNLCDNNWTESDTKSIQTILSHYSSGTFAELAGKLLN